MSGDGNGGPAATPAKIGIVAGMEMELAALGPWRDDGRVATAVSATDPDRAEAEAERLAVEGCRFLLSWGIAGGLDPALEAGTVFSAVEVLAEDGPAELLYSPAGHFAALYGSNHPVTTVAEKAELFAKTKAIAVDMETHRIAKVAHRHGIPAAAIRAIADPADRSLPKMVDNVIGEDGMPRTWPVILDLLKRPWHIATLWRLKRDTDEALDGLRTGGRELLSNLLERLDASD
ncbi:MAG: phosphorylase [Alphaproteobacteria bacterium]|nr:phosphorylase [Alphaproteobacteria bacterium]